jgi:hypothetical protein
MVSVQQECFHQGEASSQLIQEYHLLSSSAVQVSQEVLTCQCWLKQQIHHSGKPANCSCLVEGKQECSLLAIIHRQFSGWCKQTFSFLTHM